MLDSICEMYVHMCVHICVVADSSDFVGQSSPKCLERTACNLLANAGLTVLHPETHSHIHTYIIYIYIHAVHACAQVSCI